MLTRVLLRDLAYLDFAIHGASKKQVSRDREVVNLLDGLAVSLVGVNALFGNEASLRRVVRT